MPDLSKLFMYTGETQLEFIVWPLFIGICLGAFATVFIRVKLGELIRALIAKGACSPETAQSLEDLGLKNKFFIRNALKKRSSLRHVVSIAHKSSATAAGDNEETQETAVDTDPNAKIDVDSYNYYISDENRTRAEAVYDNTGSTIAVAFLTVILALAVAILSMYLIPNLIQMLENMIENIRN